jgi:hypothetical protein
MALVLLIAASAAHAQATRTWVSGVGDDANPCSRTAPCKTFAGAISKTAAGGEISVLDPGGFGVVTITKAITIDGDGTLAGILSAGTNGIIVNAGVNDKVIIRSLSINGIGTGLNGIRYLAGKELVVENSTISGVTSRGVDVALTAAGGTLTMKNVSIRNAATGVRLTTTTGLVFGMFENVSMDGATTGIDAAANSQVFANNCTINRGGTAVNASTASSLITIENSTISFNGTGVTPSAGGGVIRLSNDAIYNNTTGIAISGGQVFSDGTNRVFGNGATAPVLTGSVTRQ